MARFDQSRYDSGALYDSPSIPQKPTRMAQVKLSLDERDDDNILVFADTHVAAMVGNANFPTPAPTAVIFAAALALYRQKLLAFKDATMACREAAEAKDAARAAFDLQFTGRGNYLQEASGGVAEKILSAAVGVRDLPTPIGALPAPVDFMPTMGDEPGEIDTQWSPVHGKSSYALEWREQGTTGPWSQRLGTKSKQSVQGLTSGKTYVFRVAAVGAAGQSPWSLEAAKMAP
jgi:hypothetical protein